MYSNIVFDKTNNADGITVVVHERLAGNYSVHVQDTDADEWLPTISFYPTKESAVLAAEKILRGQR